MDIYLPKITSSCPFFTFEMNWTSGHENQGLKDCGLCCTEAVQSSYYRGSETPVCLMQ